MLQTHSVEDHSWINQVHNYLIANNPNAFLIQLITVKQGITLFLCHTHNVNAQYADLMTGVEQ